MDKTDCTLGFLLGIGAGAVIGLLLAPQSGSETRRLLALKTQERADSIQEQANDLLDSATALVETGRVKVVRQQEGVKNALEAGQKAYSYTTA